MQEVLILSQPCQFSFPINTLEVEATTLKMKCFVEVAESQKGELFPFLPTIQQMITRRDVVINSGAQFVGTDYYVATPLGYLVSLPQRTLTSGFRNNNNSYSCNTRTRGGCTNGSSQYVVNIRDCNGNILETF